MTSILSGVCLQATERWKLVDLMRALHTADCQVSVDQSLAGVRHALKAAPAEETVDPGPTDRFSPGFHALAEAVRRAAAPTTPKAWGAGLLAELLRSSPPVDAKVQNGRTALMLASHTGRVDLCEALLDARADPSAVDDKGFTPAHTVIVGLTHADGAGAAKAVLELLIARGAAVDEYTASGETPLVRGCARVALIVPRPPLPWRRMPWRQHAMVPRAMAAACRAVPAAWRSRPRVSNHRLGHPPGVPHTRRRLCAWPSSRRSATPPSSHFASSCSELAPIRSSPVAPAAPLPPLSARG